MVSQRFCSTVVEITDDDSFTTNSSCFTSPSIDSPPAIRRLRNLTLAPRNTYDLWSSIISPDQNSLDSGRDSVDSSFSSESEQSPPIKRYITRPLTIYQLEKAKSRFTFTSSTKVYIGEGDKRESDSPTTVLKIYIPPNVEKNVADRIEKHQKQVDQSKPFRMDASSNEHQRRIVVSTKYGNPNASLNDYRVVAWENNADRRIGRIENFMPEVDRQNEAINSPAASSSLPSVVLKSLTPHSESQIEYYHLNCNPLKIDPDKLSVADNTLSDVSSVKSSLKSIESVSSTSTSTSPSSIVDRFDSIKLREMTDSIFRDRVVEVGVQPWKSESLKQLINNAPRLVEEKTKKRVIFPDTQHVYENIDDCRGQSVEHSRKILPIPGKRLPFRQPPRVPVLSVNQTEFYQPEVQDIDPDISFVSYRFYDKNMREQNSLSQRCSAQLLRKSAMRLSLPRLKSKSDYNVSIRKQEPLAYSTPLRYQLNGEINRDNSILTVNGKQSCANCKLQLGRGQAMTIDSLGLFYHLHCFKCSQCGVVLNSGDSNGMEVRVNGHQIQCNQCYDSFADGPYYNHI